MYLLAKSITYLDYWNECGRKTVKRLTFIISTFSYSSSYFCFFFGKEKWWMRMNDNNVEWGIEREWVKRRTSQAIKCTLHIYTLTLWLYPIHLFMLPGFFVCRQSTAFVCRRHNKLLIVNRVCLKRIYTFCDTILRFAYRNDGFQRMLKNQWNFFTNYVACERTESNDLLE